MQPWRRGAVHRENEALGHAVEGPAAPADADAGAESAGVGRMKARRTVTFVIEGEDTVVDQVAQDLALAAIDVKSRPQVDRYKITFQKDILKPDGTVLTSEEIRE